MDRTEDSDIFDSHITLQTKTNPESNEPETDEETPVERVIRLKSPDYRQAIRHNRPLNRLPNPTTTGNNHRRPASKRPVGAIQRKR